MLVVDSLTKSPPLIFFSPYQPVQAVEGVILLVIVRVRRCSLPRILMFNRSPGYCLSIQSTPPPPCFFPSQYGQAVTGVTLLFIVRVPRRRWSRFSSVL